MNFSLDNWINNNKKGNVILFYKGNLTNDIITKLLDDLENNFENIDIPNKIRKKLYNSVVEGIQNIYHHGLNNILDNNDQNEKFGVVIIQKNNDTFEFIHGNFINNETITKLKSRLDQINSLSKDELKSLYKMILNNEEFSNKGGGGLGMIDIARKSGSKIDYEFINVNKNFTFYTFKIKI